MALQKLFEDLDKNRLRISRPSKFLFLCGGAIEKTPSARPANLRDYICRVRPMKGSYGVVLAEQATQLYRDTSYPDLITFEEDIARIAAVVLVIAESSGSLAELGAFASNDVICSTLRVIIQEKHETAESFVRFGPVERVRRGKRENLGVFPWQIRKKGSVILGSVKPHYMEIVDFISGHLDSVPASLPFAQLGRASNFYVIYWLVYVSFAVSFPILHQYASQLLGPISEEDLRDKIYCMELARWIRRIPYAGKDYFYACFGDVFEYGFKDGVLDKDSVRRKMELRDALGGIETIPPHVRKIVTEVKKANGK